MAEARDFSFLQNVQTTSRAHLAVGMGAGKNSISQGKAVLT